MPKLFFTFTHTKKTKKQDSNPCKTQDKHTSYFNPTYTVLTTNYCYQHVSNKIRCDTSDFYGYSHKPNGLSLGPGKEYRCLFLSAWFGVGAEDNCALRSITLPERVTPSSPPSRLPNN